MDPVVLPAPPMPPISSITAPLLLGSLSNTYLFGILCVQTYLYHLSFPSDAAYIKALVYGVFAIDATATIMNVSDTFQWFANGFGNPLALDNVQLSPADTPLIGALIAGIVQAFYCYRIFKIEHRAWPISVFIMLIVAVQIAGGLWGSIIAFQVQSFRSAAEKASGSPWIIFVGAAVADTLIAGTMILLLNSKQSAIHYHTKNSLSKIIQLTAETNLLSTVVALITMILFVTEKGTTYFTFPSLILGKVYSNSLLLILNNRTYLATDAQRSHQRDALGSRTGQYSSGAMNMGVLRPKTPVIERTRGIQVDMNTSVHMDQERKGNPWTHGSSY
ncbi:hypothetical protein CPB83DRAFT_864435 [Crepidotus variabilis]|uniref:DUF6534 domain-containing protein n=1 Tax=Crepidotus variabilis TaxID=179855 RepID=A0A9P6E4L0_9AGAR|nr:hypothetical protein CPB83DRAFT_864435 [Crepidotus variabilis]